MGEFIAMLIGLVTIIVLFFSLKERTPSMIERFVIRTGFQFVPRNYSRRLPVCPLCVRETFLVFGEIQRASGNEDQKDLILRKKAFQCPICEQIFIESEPEVI